MTYIEGDKKPLRSFNELTSLGTLRVDIDTLVCNKERMGAFLDLSRLLPPDLGALHILGVHELEFCCRLKSVLKSRLGQLFVMTNMYSVEGLSITLDPNEI